MPILPTLLILLSASTLASARATVATEVRSQLAAGGEMRVLVSFSIPDVDTRRKDDLRREVHAVQERALAALAGTGAAVRRRFDSVPAIALQIDARALERLERLPFVRRVDLDAGGSGSLAQSGPLIRADAVRALGFTGAGLTVAVLDSGLDTDHADLGDDLTSQACFCSGAVGPSGCCPNGADTQVGAGAAEDDHGHGSNVAGIITSAGIVSSPGIAPDAAIVAVKVLDRNNTFCCSSDIVAGLDWIINNHPEVDIVNMSLGTFALFSGICDFSTAFTQAFAAAINTLRANGTAVFASSGNTGSGVQMTAPACVAAAIAVGAVYDANVGSVSVFGCTDTTTAADKVACFANSNIQTDLFAPGAPITSDYLANGLSTFYGTSQASPHAAGCAANLLQAWPGLTLLAMETRLKSTGVPVTDTTNGMSFPRIDCLAALNAPPAPSGHVPDGNLVPGAPLEVNLDPSGDLRLSWAGSCVVTDEDFGIYRGTIGAWYDHVPVTCSTGGAMSLTIPAGAGDAYFLAVPRGLREGSHGRDGAGLERPAGPSPCLPRSLGACSPPCAHDRCTPGGPLSPACDLCVAEICNVDPFCCSTQWDGNCVAEVGYVCGVTPCPATSGSTGASPARDRLGS